jgi:hypothetical protein
MDVPRENEEVLVTSQSIIDDVLNIIETSQSMVQDTNVIIETIEICIDTVSLNDFDL